MYEKYCYNSNVFIYHQMSRNPPTGDCVFTNYKFLEKPQYSLIEIKIVQYTQEA